MSSVPSDPTSVDEAQPELATSPEVSEDPILHDYSELFWDIYWHHSWTRSEEVRDFQEWARHPDYVDLSEPPPSVAPPGVSLESLEQAYPYPLWFRWGDPPHHTPLAVYNFIGPRQRPRCAGLHELFEADDDPIDLDAEGSPFASGEPPKKYSPIPESPEPEPIGKDPEGPAPVEEPFPNTEKPGLRMLCCECHHLSSSKLLVTLGEKVRNFDLSIAAYDYEEDDIDAESTVEYERQEIECEWCVDHNRSHHYCVERCQLVEIVYEPLDANLGLSIISHAAYEVMQFSARFGDGCVRAPGPLFTQVGCCECQNKFRVSWDKGEVVETASSAAGKPKRKAIAVNLGTVKCPYCTHTVCTQCDRGTVGIRVIIGDTPDEDGIVPKILARVNTRV